MRRRALLETPIGPLFVAVAGALASIAITRGLFDPDYFWHVATGRLILETRAIPVADPFSFTWFGEPWVPDQWLADVLIVGSNALAGEAATIVFFAVAAAFGPALVAEAARRSGARTRVLVPTVLVVVASMLPQVTVRPQVLSLAFAGALLAILLRARPEESRWLWALPPLFLVWANVHGFFIVGLGIGFVYLVATVSGRTAMAERRGLVIAVGLLSLLACMLTPGGPAGIPYAVSFADTGDLGATSIVEWQSPDFHGPQFLPFLGVIGAMLLADVRRAPGWLLVIALVGAGLGLYAVRAIGIGALMVLPAVVLAGTRAQAPPPSDEMRARRALEWAAGLVIAVLLVGAALWRGPVEVDPRRVPVGATDELGRRMPDARVLARYEWAGYVLHELYERGARVFVDGRMHKYAPDVLADYLAVIDAVPGWEEIVDEHGVEAIIVSPRTRVATGPAQDADWCEAYRDQREVLLLRDCAQD